MPPDSPFRVLLADDVENFRTLVRSAIERYGPFVVVGEADDGAEAVDLARQLKPDLVLLDISMPVQDGLEALPEVIEASPRSKVVILSGFEADRLAGKAFDAGATAYLQKGIAPQALARQLVAVMGDVSEAA